MMEVYPYGGIMAYMNFHYLDGVTKQNLMLVDKTRYKYSAKKRASVVNNPKNKDEAKSLAARFGVGEMERVKQEIGD